MQPDRLTCAAWTHSVWCKHVGYSRTDSKRGRKPSTSLCMWEPPRAGRSWTRPAIVSACTVPATPRCFHRSESGSNFCTPANSFAGPAASGRRKSAPKHCPECPEHIRWGRHPSVGRLRQRIGAYLWLARKAPKTRNLSVLAIFSTSQWALHKKTNTNFYFQLNICSNFAFLRCFDSGIFFSWFRTVNCSGWPEKWPHSNFEIIWLMFSEVLHGQKR